MIVDRLQGQPKSPETLQPNVAEDRYRAAVFFQQARIAAWICVLIAGLSFFAYLHTPTWSLLVLAVAFAATASVDWWCWFRIRAHGYHDSGPRLALGAMLVLTFVSMTLTNDQLVLAAAMVLVLVVFVSSYFETPNGTVRWGVAAAVAFAGSSALRAIVSPPYLFLGFVEPFLFFFVPLAVMSIGGLFGQLTIQHLRFALTESESNRHALRVAYEDIEEQVRDRTAELEEANRQLRVFASQAEELATTQERNRLAREIHDGLAHYFTAINMQIAAGRAVLDIDRERAVSAIEKAQRLTSEGLGEVRRSVATLRESPIGNRPLNEALEPLIETCRAAGIYTAYRVYGSPRPLAPAVALALFRAVQEGLTNVRKHAHAKTVEVGLDYQEPTLVRLSIQDDGRGATDVKGGFGLIGVRERVQILGGSLTLHTTCDRGFLLVVEVPG